MWLKIKRDYFSNVIKLFDVFSHVILDLCNMFFFKIIRHLNVDLYICLFHVSKVKHFLNEINFKNF